MREFKGPKTDYSFEDGHLKTDGSYKEKITGTFIGQILGVSPYATPFGQSSRLLGLWGEDVSQKPAVITGTALEGRIIDYVKQTHPSWSVLSAEEAFPERKGDHSEWESDWDDDIFAGHLDGVITIDGRDYVLEVKTAKNLAGWMDHPPDHYLWQVYLYNHFMCQQDKAFIVLGIVNNEVYKDPNMWVPSSGNCMLFEIPIDQQAVARTIEELRKWYKTTIEQGITTPYDEENLLDKELLDHFTAIKAGIPELKAMIAEYKDLQAILDANEEKVKAEQKRAKDLKEQIKTAMSSNRLDELDGAKVITRKNSGYDFKKMVEDGIDLSKYQTFSETKVLKV